MTLFLQAWLRCYRPSSLLVAPNPCSIKTCVAQFVIKAHGRYRRCARKSSFADMQVRCDSRSRLMPVCASCDQRQLRVQISANACRAPAPSAAICRFSEILMSTKRRRVQSKRLTVNASAAGQQTQFVRQTAAAFLSAVTVLASGTVSPGT